MAANENPAGFTRVDQTTDPRFFIDFLDARRTIEGEREIKELILAMLEARAGSHVLDIGCGTGGDAREIVALTGASGRVIGIDPSEAMVAEAKRRAAGCALPLEFRTGDARKLDFPDASFDCVRTDRVLMFVPEVETALSEIFRVLRPGGVLVTSEIDHETQFIDSPFPETAKKVFDAFAASMPQPRLGRQLPRLLKQAGFAKARSVARIASPPYKWFRRVREGFFRSMVESGRLPEDELTRWLTTLEQAEAMGTFNNGVVVFTVCGQKP